MTATARTVLWWGRFDPGYSRNRILRRTFTALGWRVVDFRPRLSALGDIEAELRRPPQANLVFVPCFRQRDIAAARRYSRRHGRPLLIDPLISAYDKQVYERTKFAPSTGRARRLLAWERALFRGADAVLADTREHARFFVDTLGVAPERVHVVHVGAEEPLFAPAPPRRHGARHEVLFYGSFIALQAPEVIVAAARAYQGPAVHWALLGAGPLRARCQALAAGLGNLAFEDWLPYEKLPERIHRADILLGVFGTSPKAGRVIPNKIFQALACGRPVITRSAPAYPAGLAKETDTGITWVAPGDPQALADAVARLAANAADLAARGRHARASYERWFSAHVIGAELQGALAALGW